MPQRASNYAILGISDVSLGYGSPQILAMMQSLAKHFNHPALVLEPDQAGRKPFISPDHRVKIERLSLTTNPHSVAGRAEYVMEAARQVNRLRPRLLVIFCTYALPVLYKLHYKPDFVLYVSLESIEAYGKFDVDLNRAAREKIDMVVFPEENRARLDAERCGFLDLPLAVVYNCVNPAACENWLRPDERLPRILYSGTLDRQRTLAGYFLEPEVCHFPIDLYGALDGPEKSRLRDELNALDGDVRYRGYLEAHRLAELRKRYAWSLVLWAPGNENQLYACPNKFFDAIADGVPPITAPHPQAKMLVERYRCGLVMPDWSFEAWRDTLRQALALLGTQRYAEMVQNCRTAVMAELNWEAQFAKVKRLLPEKL